MRVALGVVLVFCACASAPSVLENQQGSRSALPRAKSLCVSAIVYDLEGQEYEDLSALLARKLAPATRVPIELERKSDCLTRDETTLRVTFETGGRNTRPGSHPDRALSTGWILLSKHHERIFGASWSHEGRTGSARQDLDAFAKAIGTLLKSERGAEAANSAEGPTPCR